SANTNYTQISFVVCDLSPPPAQTTGKKHHSNVWILNVKRVSPSTTGGCLGSKK
ncbi:hypothetical protein L917_01871, partial [Phytophthora nicotianae]